MEIIITDLTRFNTSDKVCIAGININTNKCIRPMPYLTATKCEELNILPGSKLNGDFQQNTSRGFPHSEDNYYNNLTHNGACTADEFHEVLNNTIAASVSDGFGYLFPEGGKVIPYTNIPHQSIVTVKVKSSQIRIVKDSFSHGKIKLNLKDNDNKKYTYLPITDLGFYNYAMKHFNDIDFPEKINAFIDEQEELYLRVGLSGRYADNNGRDGYWLQINGIYTFPNFDAEIRSYT